VTLKFSFTVCKFSYLLKINVAMLLSSSWFECCQYVTELSDVSVLSVLLWVYLLSSQ